MWLQFALSGSIKNCTLIRRLTYVNKIRRSLSHFVSYSSEENLLGLILKKSQDIFTIDFSQKNRAKSAWLITVNKRKFIQIHQTSVQIQNCWTAWSQGVSWWWAPSEWSQGWLFFFLFWGSRKFSNRLYRGAEPWLWFTRRFASWKIIQNLRICFNVPKKPAHKNLLTLKTVIRRKCQSSLPTSNQVY